MRIDHHKASWAIISLAAIAPQAQATVVSYSFSGVVSYIDTEITGTFAFGNTIAGTISIDSATTNLNTEVGLGFYPAAVYSLNFAIGDQSYQLSSPPPNNSFPSFFEVFDNPITDPGMYSYDIGSYVTGPGVDGYVPRLFQIGLFDKRNPPVINSVAIPDTFDFDDFSGNFGLDFGDEVGGPNYEVAGTLSSFAAIPEPGTLPLLGLAVGGSAGLLRPRRRGPLPIYPIPRERLN